MISSFFQKLAQTLRSFSIASIALFSGGLLMILLLATRTQMFSGGSDRSVQSRHSVSFAHYLEQKPQLVVVLVVDQCRADTLTRFQSSFNSPFGYNFLMKNSAYYPNARYNLLQAMTCPGHATILTGATPQRMGIPLNNWYDSQLKREVYCTDTVRNPALPVVSPEFAGNVSDLHKVGTENLVGSTVGDELKLSGRSSRVISIALKDRAAVMLGGHLADLTLWQEKGEWVTSSQYATTMPAWVNTLNQQIRALPDVVQIPMPQSSIPNTLLYDTEVGELPAQAKRSDKAALATPYGIELTTTAALHALQEMKLGQREGETDVLAVSYSAHDYVGHALGPNSRANAQMAAYEDESISRLVQAIDQTVGLSNTVIVFTGDHGVGPAPRFAKELGMPAGRLEAKAIEASLNKVLSEQFGKRIWVAKIKGLNIYLDFDQQMPLEKRERILQLAKSTLLQDYSDGIANVILRSDFDKGVYPVGRLGDLVKSTYLPGKSGDLVIVPQPFWTDDSVYATHLTGYSYDSEVPLLMMGKAFRAGVYSAPAQVIDIAPTLAFILGTVSPSGSEGRVLSESLQPH